MWRLTDWHQISRGHVYKKATMYLCIRSSRVHFIENNKQGCGAGAQISDSGSRHLNFLAPSPERFGPVKTKNHCFICATRLQQCLLNGNPNFRLRLHSSDNRYKSAAIHSRRHYSMQAVVSHCILTVQNTFTSTDIRQWSTHRQCVQHIRVTFISFDFKSYSEQNPVFLYRDHARHRAQ